MPANGILAHLNPQRIVILRALQLGDLLCSVPAFRALRFALPEAHITLIGLPWASELAERFRAYLDAFIPFPGFPGFPEREPDVAGFPHFLEQVQQYNFDLAIQMQGAGSLANSLVPLFGAQKTAGFRLPGEYCSDEALFLPYPASESEPWRQLRLMEFLGAPPQGDQLEFPLSENDWSTFQQLDETSRLRKDYICIQPGARAADRRWPAAHFASVADELAAWGYQIVLTGTYSEMEATDTVKSNMRAPVIDMTGKTTLGTLAALLANARLILCNDTGVSHLAASLNIPSVVLFSNGDPNRWAPHDNDIHRLVLHAMKRSPVEVLHHLKSQLLYKAPAHVSP